MMRRNGLRFRLLILTFLIICFLLVNVKAGNDNGSKATLIPFRQIIDEISKKFGVVIIVEPSLTGMASQECLQKDSAETILRELLDPLGYSYTKIEDYYLISGPKSPLTVLAETDSSLVPVGFLASQNQDQLNEFREYLTYDESSGVVYVKAPSSKMNKILSKLWDLSKTSGQISVVYSLQIIDLGNSSDFDFVFSGKYDNTMPDGKTIMITPDQWSLDGPTSVLIQQKVESLSTSLVRQPWFITVPGKTVRFISSIRLFEAGLDVDRYFTIQLTPLKVDESSGKVVSNVIVERNMQASSNITVENAPKVSEDINKVNTTIGTIPGKRELLAIVRHTSESDLKMLGILGRAKVKQHRDFIVFISAAPINIQTTLATPSGLIPVASLGGIGRLTDEQEPLFKLKPVLELGIAGEKDENGLNGWFNFRTPLGSSGSLTLDYRKDDLYSAGLSFSLDSDREVSLDFLAGNGIGPNYQNAIMVGLGDVTQPAPYMSLFAKYYPVSYLLDAKENSYDAVWNAGVRLGTNSFGFTISTEGNPGFEGWHYKLDFNEQKRTWVLEVDTTRKNPLLYLGMGFKF